MTYQPNLNDPRVQKRIRSALGFTLACIGSKPSRWAKVALDRHFGQSQHALGQWLRRVLLITSDDHYSMDEHLPKEYVLRQSGVEYLRRVLRDNLRAGWDEWLNEHQQKSRDEDMGQKAGTGGHMCHHHHLLLAAPAPSVSQVVRTGQSNADGHHLLLAAPAPSVSQVPDPVFDNLVVDAWVEREFGDQLKTHAFAYEDKSSRLWHPIQSMRREHKKRILAAYGLRFHYDIVACAPTLLLQHGQMLPDIPERGIWTMDLWLFAYQHYLKHRQTCRERLASLLGMDVSYAKTVLNSLFCGAKVGAGDNFSLYRLLGSRDRIQRLKDDVFITDLRKDIKVLWSYIEPTMTRIEKKDRNGRTYKVPLSSKRKWLLYFDLERQVLNAVKDFLGETGNTCFLEHDGWATRDAVDEKALLDYIKRMTGFSIQLEMSAVTS